MKKIITLFLVIYLSIPGTSLSFYPGETLNPSCPPTDPNCNIDVVTGTASGGTGQSVYSPGDILYATGTSTLAKLNIGSDGNILKVISGLPVWAVGGGGGTDYFASGLGLTLNPISNTFALVLDGSTLLTASSGLKISPTYSGQTSITTLGTITSGHWDGDEIDATNGGTGLTTYAIGDLLYGASTSSLSRLPAGSENSVLKMSGGLPYWGSDNVGPSYLASELAIRLATTTNTFSLLLADSTLTQATSGLKISPTYSGQTSITTLGTITSGHWDADMIDIAHGGTGLITTPTNGQLPIGNGSGYTLAPITGGDGLSITNGPGSITIGLGLGTLPTITSMDKNDYVPIYGSTSPYTRKKITFDDMMTGIKGSLNYQGYWDAESNSPHLDNSMCNVDTKGKYYIVNVAGTTTLNSISEWDSTDWLICHGSDGWFRIINTHLVNSVFGRRLDVVAQTGDYNASQVTYSPYGTITSTTTQAAINYLEDSKQDEIATGTTSQFLRGDKTWQVLNTSLISEDPSALYFTNQKARDAISTIGSGLSYDSASGTISVSSGYLIPTTASTTNWNSAVLWGNHALAGYLTGIAGDATSTGSGIATLTLLNVNSTPGLFGSPTSTVSINVNSKGLVTSVSQSAIEIPQTAVLGLSTDLDNKLSKTLNPGYILIGNALGEASSSPLTLSASAGSFGLSNSGVLTMPNSGVSSRGLLSSTDWNTFNNKQNSLGFTAENISNKTTSITTDGGSDDKYPSAKAVKTYADSLSLGMNWKNPVEIINVVKESTSSPGTVANFDAYIISPGGDWTSVDPSFAPGDLVQYQTSSWVKIKSLVTGDRFGVAFKSTTTPSGPFTGYKNNLVVFDSTINGSNYTYTFTAPTNNDAVYVQNANAYYKNVSFVYSSSLTQWVQLSASVNYSFGNGLSTVGSTVSLGSLTADWNQAGNYAITTNGKINLNSGILDTTTSTVSLFNQNAQTLNIGAQMNYMYIGSSNLAIKSNGALSIVSTSTENITIDSGTTGDVDIGVGDNAKTLNFGTGNAGNVINIGTNNTVADTINIGSVLDSFTLNSSGLKVTTSGALTGVSSINNINVSSSTLAFAGAANITSSSSNAITIDSGTTGAVNIGTGNSSKTINLGTGSGVDTVNIASGSGGNIINIATDNSIADAITIGSVLDSFTLNSSGLNVSSSGALTNVSSIDTITFSTSSIVFTSNGLISSAGTNSITLDSSTTGAVNIGTGNNAKTINVGTGTAGNSINIGTNNTIADTITIGSALDSFALNSSGLNISSSGDLTNVTSINTIAFSTSSIIFASNGLINSTGTNAITLDSGTTGSVNIGTGNNAKTINVGTGNAGNAINIGTNNTATDTITLGSSKDTFTLNSSGLNIDSTGIISGVKQINDYYIGTGYIMFGGSALITSNADQPITIDSSTTGAVNLGTGNNNKTINIGTGSASDTVNIASGSGGNVINIATNNSIADTITLGSALDSFTLNSSGLNVSSSGALTGVTSLDNISVASTSITFAGIGLIKTSSINSINIDSGTTGAVNLGTGNNAKAINIGTGNAGNTISIGTNNTVADTITLGSALDSFTLNSSGLNVSSGGALTGVDSINTINFATDTIGFFTEGRLVSNSSYAITLDSGTTGNVNVGTGNNAKIINLGTGNAGNIINVGTNNTVADAITIGSALDSFALHSTGVNITAEGAVSGVNSLNTISVSTSTLAFAGIGNILSTDGNSITVDSGTTGNVNIGTGNSAKTINVGTGISGNTINIGTNNTVADAITIGSALDSFTLNSSGVNISSSGQITGISLLNSFTLGTSSIEFQSSGAIRSNTTNAITLDSGTTGNVNIGTGSYTKTITIGNETGTTSLSLVSGTGNINIGSNLVSKTINMGVADGVSQNINIGGTGSNDIAIGNTQTSGTIKIGNALVGGSIVIGGTGAQTGNIDIGTGTGLQVINLGSGNGSKTINLGTGTAGNSINIGTNNTVADAITIGSALDSFALNSTGLNVATNGSLTGVTSINTVSITSSALTFAGSGSILSNNGNPLTLDSSTNGNVNLGTGNNAKTINIGTGNAGDTINLGTNNTVADTIYLGSALDSLTITSTGLKVATSGAMTGVASINTISVSSTTLAFAGAANIISSGANAITLDSGTTGTVNIGTGNSAKSINIGTGTSTNTITIGNSTDGATLNLFGGTGGVYFTGYAAATGGNNTLCINSSTKRIYIGGSATSCNTSSERFKQNIADIKLGLNAIKALRPVSYEFISNGGATLGFIAEEVQYIDERLINRDENGLPYSLNSDTFIPILTKAVQELDNKFTTLTLNNGTNNIASDLSEIEGLSINGEVTLNKDTVGEVVILTGESETQITFSKPYKNQPIVTISKLTRATLDDYYIDEITKQGFKIKIEPLASHDIRFSWHSFGLISELIPEGPKTIEVGASSTTGTSATNTLPTSGTNSSSTTQTGNASSTTNASSTGSTSTDSGGGSADSPSQDTASSSSSSASSTTE